MILWVLLPSEPRFPVVQKSKDATKITLLKQINDFKMLSRACGPKARGLWGNGGVQIVRPAASKFVVRKVVGD